MIPTCVNLKERFGSKWRIGYDPVYRPGEKPDPWMMLIVCRYGEIGPHGDNQLRWDCDGYGKVRAKMKRLACTEVWSEVYTEGDDDICVLFDVANIDQVARVVKPRSRRVLTDEERQRLAEMGFQGHRKGPQGGHRRPPGTQPDPKHLS